MATVPPTSSTSDINAKRSRPPLLRSIPSATSLFRQRARKHPHLDFRSSASPATPDLCSRSGGSDDSDSEESALHTPVDEPESSVKGLSSKDAVALLPSGPDIEILPTEFGPCDNNDYRFTSMHPKGAPFTDRSDPPPPLYITITACVSIFWLLFLGLLRDACGKCFKRQAYRHLRATEGYAPLTSDMDSFFSRRVVWRCRRSLFHPITGVAGRTLNLIDRYLSDDYKTFIFPGTRTRALNVASYNYLGFAQARGGCADAVAESLRLYGTSAGGPRLEAGSNDLHGAAEALVARFVGAEDSLICSMGFATNATIIPALVGKGCLVLSDERNHASIRTGVHASGAEVRPFAHNDMNALERLLRTAISQGQRRTHQSWRKIMVIVEGLYSMEGTIANLPALLELKRKYKFYLFVDEAHSIGALGPHGRGICDYFGVDPQSVDILMGTFTKSFGAAGGYVASTRATIDRLRLRGYAGAYAESMAPPVLTQIIASMASIMGVVTPLPASAASTLDTTITHTVHPCPMPASLLPTWMSLPPTLRDGSAGCERMQRLAFNARYLSQGLIKLGFVAPGHIDSPIVPLILFQGGKLPVFHSMLLERDVPIITVVVGAPATQLLAPRARFCVSAAHTKEDIDEVLRACDEVGDVLDLRHGLPKNERWPLQRVLTSTSELVGVTNSAHA